MTLRTLQDWVVRPAAPAGARASPTSCRTAASSARDPRRARPDEDGRRSASASTDVFTALQKASANATGGYVERGTRDVRDPQPRHLQRHRRHRRRCASASTTACRSRARRRAGDEGYAPRQGVVTRDDDEDAVEGIVLMRRGENPSVVLAALRETRRPSSTSASCPKGVKINAVLRPHRPRRTRRSRRCSTTSPRARCSSRSCCFAFMLSLRASLIVATVIPLSLARVVHLPARARHEREPALDGRGRLRDHRRRRGHPRRAPVPQAVAAARRAPARSTTEPLRERIFSAAREVARPTLFSLLIIIAAYLPIFSLQRVEGRIFSPLAQHRGERARRRAARELHARAGALRSSRCGSPKPQRESPLLALGAARLRADARASR